VHAIPDVSFQDMFPRQTPIFKKRASRPSLARFDPQIDHQIRG
jgi:hypothetical protein